MSILGNIGNVITSSLPYITPVIAAIAAFASWRAAVISSKSQKMNENIWKSSEEPLLLFDNIEIEVETTSDKSVPFFQKQWKNDGKINQIRYANFGEGIAKNLTIGYKIVGFEEIIDCLNENSGEFPEYKELAMMYGEKDSLGEYIYYELSQFGEDIYATVKSGLTNFGNEVVVTIFNGDNWSYVKIPEIYRILVNLMIHNMFLDLKVKKKPKIEFTVEYENRIHDKKRIHYELKIEDLQYNFAEKDYANFILVTKEVK